MEGSRTLFCSSKFPCVRVRIYSKFIDSLRKRPKKGSPVLDQGCLKARLD